MKKINTSIVVSIIFIFQLFFQNPIFASNSPIETLGTLDEIDTIRVIRNGRLMTAEIDPIAGATNYTWNIGQGAQILSGQGTVTLEIDWGAAELSTICVVASNNSMQSPSRCRHFFDVVNIPPCLPTAGGVPAGNVPPGCYLCGPIYQGSTGRYFPRFPGSDGFPCGTVENNQFIAIVADASANISATILASRCQNGQGVEMVIYDLDFNPVSSCFSSQGVNIPGNVMATGLVPGDTYWIMIDGFLGDVCDILVTTSGGTNTGPPDPPGPMTVNPDTSPLCPGAIVCYSIAPVNGASGYEWIIPGNATIVSGGRSDDTQVCVEYIAPGGGVVRVTPSNPCFPGIPVIEPVVVLPILPTLKPPEFVCPQDFPIMRDGNVFNDPGSHEITYKTVLGCDSVVTYIFIPSIQIPHSIDTTICAGECVQVGLNCYDQPIAQTITLSPPFSQANGCDSIVILKINILEPVAVIQSIGQIGCNPGDVTDLDGTASSTGNRISYKWTAINGGVLAGPSNTNFTQAAAPGTYILEVTQTDPSGIACVTSDSINVTLRNTGVQMPIFSNAETSVCASSSHTYTVSPVAGALPNDYQWTFPVGAFISQNSGSNSVEITFGNESLAGQICVVATSSCGDSRPACVPITINAIPTSDFTITNPICITDASTITYTGTGSPFANYTWNFNAGTSPTGGTGLGHHQVSWTSPGPKTITLNLEENGCPSTQTTQVVQVDAELPELFISCATTDSSIDFSWNSVSGATDYTVTVTPGGTTVQAGTDFPVNGLTQGDEVSITVVANGTSACGSRTATTTCTAQNCPTFNLNIDPVASICRDASTGSINLSANPTGGAGGGTLVWEGNAVSGNTFDPLLARSGINVVALEYTEGLCTTIETIDIEINNVPDPAFNISGQICIGELATVTYTGSASGGALFNWDFGAGTIAVGAGAGPYEIDFSSAPGIQTINLSVEENGCTSPVVSRTVQVDQPLPAPVVRCAAATSTSVTIEWDVEPGITYTVNPPVGNIDMTAGTITVVGLNPGDQVSGEIVAEGTTTCGSSSMKFMCEASNCPPESVTIDPIGPFCKDGTGGVVTLNASAGDNSGTFTFSGPGVSHPNIFDPNSPTINPGIATVQALYQKDNCSYRGSLDVEIIAQPSADFTVTDPICIRDQSIVTYTGGADPSATFTWNFGTGNAISGTNSGPYEISWSGDLAGTKDITLTVEENGCISLANTVQITVDEPLTPPVISCISDQNNINFSWDAVNGALTYDAEVLSTNVPVLSNIQTNPLFWNFGGLNPGDFIEIEVTAYGPTACGPTSSSLLCLAQNCNDYSVIMPQIDTCLYTNILSFSLASDLFITNFLGEDLIDSVNLFWFGAPNSNYLSADGSFSSTIALNELGVGDIPIFLDIEYPRGSGCFKTHNSTIRIDEKLKNLNLQCDINNSGNQSIGFVWDDIGANDITIEVINSNVFPLPFATSSTNTSAFFDGMNPRDEITLKVTADDTNSLCPEVSETLTCLAKDCPATVLEIAPIASFCEGEQLQIQSALTIMNDPCNGGGNTTWSGDGVNSDGTIDTDSLPAGIYELVAQYVCNGCTYRATAEFEIFPKPILTAEIAHPIWAISSSGSIDLTVSNSTPNYLFAWDNGEVGEDISNAAPGNYCVTVGDQNGCFATDCYVINNGIYRVSPIHIMCRGEQEKLTVRPGRGADFNWSPSDGLSCTDCPNPIASPSQSTIYTVSATLPSGQIDSTKILVFVLPPVLCNSPRMAEISNQMEGLDFTNFEKNDLKYFENQLIEFVEKGDSKLDNLFSSKTQRIDNPRQMEVQIIPNPTSGEVTILSDFEVEKIEVFDFSGKEILNQNSSKIDLSIFPQGVYILKIKTAEGEFVKRVVLMPR